MVKDFQRGGPPRGGRGGDRRGGDRRGGPPRGRRGAGGRGGMRMGVRTIIEPHRFPGVFIARGKDDALVTLNMTPGESVYQEKRIAVPIPDSQEKIEYRVWNPYRSKLAAAILGNIDQIWIEPGSKVLYLGAASGTTVSHVADLVGQEGTVYAVEFSHRSGRDLVNMAKSRTNVVPIVEDARHPLNYRMLVPMVDVIFEDVAQPDQARILALNAQHYLKQGGHFIISIKANCIDSTLPAETVFTREIETLREFNFFPSVKMTLEPYEIDHAVVAGSYRVADEDNSQDQHLNNMAASRLPSSGYLDLHPNTQFPELQNSRLLSAARGQEVDQLPVWIMRQAGRYLPEFRALREQHDFFTMCTTPQLAREVTLQPIERFPFDAAIVFSDILVVPQAMGMEVQMVPGKGPVFPKPLLDPSQIEDLKWPDLATSFEPYFEAIFQTRLALEGKVPLLGFVGGPFTLFAYMVEGEGSKTFGKTKQWLFKYPEESKRVLNMLTEIVSEFLLGQISSGAQMVQVFESHAGVLGPEDFNVFLLPYITRIAEYLKGKGKANPALDVPLTIFAKDAHYALPALFSSPYDVIGLDWTADIARAKELAEAHGKTLQGNLDPYLLFSPDDELVKRTKAMLDAFGKQRYIVNLGHGIDPGTDPEKVRLFINTVHEYSQSLS